MKSRDRAGNAAYTRVTLASSDLNPTWSQIELQRRQ